MPRTNPERYLTPRDLETYLYMSIIRYQNRPLYIQRTYDDMHVLGLYLDDMTQSPRIHSSDEDLDISTPPIGYVNLHGNAFYISRIPRRRQKQGLNHNDIEVVPVIPHKGIYDNSHVLYTQATGKTILNDFPTGDFALKELRKGNVNAIAFHRKYSLARDELGIVKLHHMNFPIGYIPPNETKIIIPEDKIDSFFTEYLQSTGLEVTSA